MPPKQPELFATPTFGARCRGLLEQEAKTVGRLTWDRAEAIIQEEYERATPAEKRVRANTRHALYSHLCKACGLAEEEMTKTQQRLVAVALAEMLQVKPDLDPAGLEWRVAAYRRAYPNAPVTPKALANHFGEFKPPPPKRTGPIEPDNWRDVFASVFPDMTLPDHYKFTDLPTAMQAKVTAAAAR